MNRIEGSIKGFTLIEILIVITIILVVCAISISSFARVRIDSNESAALTHTRIISNALLSYSAVSTPSDYPESLLNLSSPSAGPAYIDAILGSGQKQGYNFNYTRLNNQQFDLFIEPVSAGYSGERFFYIDETGVIRYKKGTRAGKNDPTLD